MDGLLTRSTNHRKPGIPSGEWNKAIELIQFKFIGDVKLGEKNTSSISKRLSNQPGYDASKIAHVAQLND